jgi:hypothetical protein
MYNGGVRKPREIRRLSAEEPRSGCVRCNARAEYAVVSGLISTRFDYCGEHIRAGELINDLDTEVLPPELRASPNYRP